MVKVGAPRFNQIRTSHFNILIHLSHVPLSFPQLSRAFLRFDNRSWPMRGVVYSALPENFTV